MSRLDLFLLPIRLGDDDGSDLGSGVLFIIRRDEDLLCTSRTGYEIVFTFSIIDGTLVVSN